MSSLLEPYTWTPIETWAAEHGLPVAEVMHDIAADRVIGGRIDSHWHVCASRVELTHPDPQRPDHIRLRIAAVRDDHYLTAARRALVLPLRADDPDLKASLDTLLEYLQGPLLHPVSFRLGGRDWCVDSSLHLDLVMTILEFEVAQNTDPQPAIPVAGAA